MTEEALPSDWEQLGELITSGEMTEAQVSQVIDEHVIHRRDDCVGCETIVEIFNSTPIELVIDKYADSLTLEQRRLLYQNFEEHLVIEDGWTAQYARRVKLEVASGKSADRALLSTAAWDYEDFVEYFRSEPGDDSLREQTRKFAERFAEHLECDEDIIRELVERYHSYGYHGDCIGEFEACDNCLDIIEDVVAKLK
jgi:hypothetical protein